MSGTITTILIAYRWAKSILTKEHTEFKKEVNTKIDNNFKEVNLKMDLNNSLILEKLNSQDKQMDHIKKATNHISSELNDTSKRLTDAEKQIIETVGVFKGLEFRVIQLEKKQ